MLDVFIGYDRRYPDTYAVAKRSLTRRSTMALHIRPLFLPALIADKIYTRPTVFSAIMHDAISNAPMASEFSISRFFVPYLNNYKGWALFFDNDFLFLDDVAKLMEYADPTKAVMVVKHRHEPTYSEKMEGQVQLAYPRKNWSSLMLFNCEHPANQRITPALCNAVPGRDLHALRWLHDEEIGDLPEEWNWLEGHSSMDLKPKAVHFTRGVPSMKGYENVPYSDLWREELGGIEQCK